MIRNTHGKNYPYHILIALLILFQTLSICCKKSATSPETKNLGPLMIFLTCMPSDAQTRETVSVNISIESPHLLDDFRLDLTFTPLILRFKSISVGDLTQNWDITGEKIAPATIHIHGWRGNSNPIEMGNRGIIASIVFEVRGEGINHGHESDICIKNYADGIENLTPEPSCRIFTYQRYPG